MLQPVCARSDLEVADPLEDGIYIAVSTAGTSTVYLLADAAFLSWFARESPNRTSEGGRYTFMGDLNPFAFFHKPPATC